MFQSQELTDLTSQRPGGGEGGGSHTPTLGADGKRLLKSAANWFSVENEHLADFKQCRFGPVSTQSVTGRYQWSPPC